jgi:hypothetical protein
MKRKIIQVACSEDENEVHIYVVSDDGLLFQSLLDHSKQKLYWNPYPPLPDREEIPFGEKIAQNQLDLSDGVDRSSH